MSHELRVPLNSIIGFTEINTPIPGEKPPKIDIKKYIGDVNQSGKDLLNTINGMVDFAQFEAGEMTLDESYIDVRKILNLCFNKVEKRAIEAEISLSVRIEDPLPKIFADERKITNVVTTLVSNAIKYTKAKGNIIIWVHYINDGRFEFFVKDNGIGFREKDIEKILSPFGQVEGILERQQIGTGLGFPLVKANAEIHGGEFIIESQPNVGTNCRFILPSNRITKQKLS